MQWNPVNLAPSGPQKSGCINGVVTLKGWGSLNAKMTDRASVQARIKWL